MAVSLSNVTDEILSIFVFYSTILAANFIILSYLTGQARLKYKAFTNPEDAKSQGDITFHRSHEHVKRLKRIQRNDAENVLPFIVVGMFYMTAGPNVVVFTWFMRIYTVTRVLYTMAYANIWPTPSRTVFYCIGAYLCYIPMLFIVLWSCCF